MKINRQDTNGVKPLLAVGELGYDNYPSGGDIGRVYVGTGSSNIAQAKKSEVVTVDGKIDAHVARIDNPHGVTRAQVGLSNVDNTSDVNKPVSTSTQNALDLKQNVLVSGTNIKTIEGQSIVGSGNIDLTKTDVGLNNVDNTADSAKVVASASKWTTSRLVNGTAVDGTVDITTSQWGTSRDITIGNTTKSVNGSTNISWSLNEIGAIGTASPAFTGVPTAPTATVNTNTTQLATTAFVNAEIANDAIPRVTSINTAIPKFDGVSGAIQSSNILINSSDNVILPKASGGSLTISLVDGASNTNLVLPESGTVATQAYVDGKTWKDINYKSTPITITSWSYSGTTITLNVASHNYEAGEYIEVSGLTSTTYPANGIHLVTSVTSATIVFTLGATPTGTAGVSTARVKGITTLNGKIISEDIGINQSWQLVTRLSNTNYSNTSSRMIKMVVYGNSSAANAQINVIITPIGSTTAITIPIGTTTSSAYGGFNFSIPAGCTYKIAPISGTFNVATWYEFR